MRRMSRPPLLLLLGIAVPGCGSGPDYPIDVRPSAERTVRVELLDRYFVRADGERLPRDRFLYRMREDCRRLSETGGLPPRVVLVWAEGLDLQDVASEFERQLQLAGIGHLKRGDGG